MNWTQLSLFDTIELNTTEGDTMQEKPVIEEVPYEEMHLVDLLDEEVEDKE